MNNGIQIFKRGLLVLQRFFESVGYNIFMEEIYNPHSSEDIFYKCTFENQALRKKINFIFYPPNRKILNNEISVHITKNDSVSIDIATYLAYKELNTSIKFEDTKKYRFKIENSNLEGSIGEQLSKIKDTLTNQLNNILTTDEWIAIPVHDPRDDY